MRSAVWEKVSTSNLVLEAGDARRTTNDAPPTTHHARRFPCGTLILEHFSPFDHPIFMRFFQTLWRFLVSVQLLPALEGGEETLVGGQAVLEGVMMRTPHAWSITCRKPSGELMTHSEPLERLSEKHKWMGWPVVRGVMTLGHAMTLGFRALRFSANVALDEIPADDKGKKLEVSGWMAAVNIIFSLVFFIFMYKFLPLLAATELKRINPLFGQQVIFNLVDGAIRITLFLLFIWGVSLWRDIYRVYQYPGAEHQTGFSLYDRVPLHSALRPQYTTH